MPSFLARRSSSSSSKGKQSSSPSLEGLQGSQHPPPPPSGASSAETEESFHDVNSCATMEQLYAYAYPLIARALHYAIQDVTSSRPRNPVKMIADILRTRIPKNPPSKISVEEGSLEAAEVRAYLDREVTEPLNKALTIALQNFSPQDEYPLTSALADALEVFTAIQTSDEPPATASTAFPTASTSTAATTCLSPPFSSRTASTSTASATRGWPIGQGSDADPLEGW